MVSLTLPPQRNHALGWLRLDAVPFLVDDDLALRLLRTCHVFTSFCLTPGGGVGFQECERKEREKETRPLDYCSRAHWGFESGGPSEVNQWVAGLSSTTASFAISLCSLMEHIPLSSVEIYRTPPPWCAQSRQLSC